MNTHLTAALVAAAVAGVFTAGAEYAQHRRPQTIVVRADAATTQKHLARQAAIVWPELDQATVDKLTTALKSIDKSPVELICASQTLCGDLALDLENAFESAHWTVNIVAPLMDSTVGLSCNDPALAVAVGSAIGATVAIVPKVPNHPTFIVLGRKT